LFDEQEDSLNTHNMDAIFKDVQGCMNVFVEMYGNTDNLLLSFHLKIFSGLNKQRKNKKNL
jgi:hypothetical protein